MKPSMLVVAFALMTAAGHAQETAVAEPDSFQDRVVRVASDPSVAGQWVMLLPVIAQQCDMVVDHDRVAMVVDGFENPEAVDDMADYFASHPESRLKAAWDVIEKRNQEEACRLADSFWGETGKLFQKVLRRQPAASGRMISQHAIGEGTR